MQNRYWWKKGPGQYVIKLQNCIHRYSLESLKVILGFYNVLIAYRFYELKLIEII